MSDLPYIPPPPDDWASPKPNTEIETSKEAQHSTESDKSTEIKKEIKKNHAGRSKGCSHYAQGKQEAILTFDEVVDRIDHSPIMGEQEAFFWLSYYLGIRKMEALSLPCSALTLEGDKLWIDVGQRLKGSAKTDKIPLDISWHGVDKIIATWNKHKILKPVNHRFISWKRDRTLPKEERSKHPIKIETVKKDVWLFLNISPATGTAIVKKALGDNKYYHHYLRLLRLSEISDSPNASIIMIRSFSGLRSLSSIQKYLGTSKKALSGAMDIIGEHQPKKTPNIPVATEEPKTSS